MKIKTKKQIIALFCCLSMSLGTGISESFAASSFFSSDNDGSASDTFTLDKDNTSATFIDLLFAGASAYLRYDISATKFILSHALDLGNNQLLNARIENVSAAPTCNSGAKGKLYFDTDDNHSYVCNGTTFTQVDNSAGGSGDVVGPSSSVDNEVALFNSTTGKLIKSATISGLAKLTAGVLSAASAGTDYVAPNAAITGATKTKITYDAKGLVTAGADATLASADFANQGTTTTVLHGNAAGNPSWGAVTEGDITLADNTTNDFSITKHGFVPKGTNTGKYLKDDGTWATVTASASAGGSNTQVQYNNATALGGITNATSDGTTLTITSPKVVTSLNDSSGNELFKFTATGTAINELTLANAAAGGTPTLSATGGDTDIGITLASKGAGNITLTGEMVWTPSSTQAITAAGNTILANAATVILNPDGNYTMTSTPTIADGTIGQVVVLMTDNAEANKIVLQDGATLSNSNLRLGNTVRELTKYDSLSLVFDGTEWVEKAYSPTAMVLDVYTNTGGNTWTKPVGARTVEVIICGAGGAGGGGSGAAAASVRTGGGGGGGGFCASKTFLASELGATETVTIGVGSAGATGGTGAAGGDGATGGNSTFGTFLTGYGGGGGAGNAAGAGGGAGGGGTGIPSVLATTTTGGTGGPCGLAGGAANTATATCAGAGGGTATTSALAGPISSYGGAGGAPSATTAVVAGGAGGSSMFSAGAGGSGGGVNAANPGTAQNGGVGGNTGNITAAGGGGAAGLTASNCGAGGEGQGGAVGTSLGAGKGGGGGSSKNAATGCNGGAGGAGGGGGGGGGGGTNVGGNGGKGGDGKAWVWTKF